MDYLHFIFLGILVLVIIIAVILIIVLSKKAENRGYERRKTEAEAIFGSAEEEGKRMMAEAEKQGEAKKREYLLAAKEEVHKCKLELEKEIKDRRNEMQRSENRLIQKEESIDRKQAALEEKDAVLNQKLENAKALEEKAKAEHEKQVAESERISGFTREEAKTYLLQALQTEITHEAATKIRENEERIKQESDRKAKEILATAIQKSAASYVSDTTVSVVSLPNDDMKGRIIGREGRNIRALETLTGIDLIIDDTPEAVIISGFDPIRREIARIALEKLIIDGRIHPARIEEMVEKAKKEVETTIKQAGENATYEVGVFGLHPEIVRLLGRMKYRTSYGQSVLVHSIEVARLCGIMAAELGLDVEQAKRAGLVHDIGKAIDFEMEGSHITIGADIAKKYNESPEIINAIMAHHGDEEARTEIAVLVQAADAISAARPGARSESLESYIKRLEKLEEISNSFNGVESTYAVQAGREIRIMVKPEVVSDDNMVIMAREIANRIENEMEYPGQIKVTIMRETRTVEYAK